MVGTNYINYDGYGKCLEITNGTLRLVVTTEMGPRVIHASVSGSENIMYEDRGDLINKSGEFFDTNYGKDEAWHIYGGHRLWKSPEDLASYAPDNYPVGVEITPCGAVFTAKAEKLTGIQKIIEVQMGEGNCVKLIHSFKNVSDKAVNYSLWCLSVMNKGGTGYIPLSTEDTGLLANRNLAIWSYTDIQDKRIRLEQDALIVSQDPEATSAIKLGTLASLGKAYYLLPTVLFEKNFPYIATASYPDYESSMECYTNNIMMEIETLSPLTVIDAGDTASHVESWTLHVKGSAEYEKVAARIS